MAQIVGYYDDNVTFEEGPFVICNPLGNGWRIEVEYKGTKSGTPALPVSEVYSLIRDRFGHVGKWAEQKEVTKVCDWLNQQVREGNIVLEGAAWTPR